MLFLLKFSRSRFSIVYCCYCCCCTTVNHLWAMCGATPPPCLDPHSLTRSLSPSRSHAAYVIFRFMEFFLFLFWLRCESQSPLRCGCCFCCCCYCFRCCFCYIKCYPQRVELLLAIQWKVFAITLNITHTICTILFILVINCLLNNYVARRHLWHKKYVYRYIDRCAPLSTTSELALVQPFYGGAINLQWDCNAGYFVQLVVNAISFWDILCSKFHKKF